MEKHYKKLMESKKTLLARFIDGMFILLFATIISFGYCIIRLGNMLSAIIITMNIDIIILLFMSKMQNIRLNHFRRDLDSKIRDKLILEQIAFSKGDDIDIKGYKRIGSGKYVNEQGEEAILLALYPQSVLTPGELLKYVTGNEKEIIASCTFDDDCFLLCERMGINLKDRSFLLENAEMNIDDDRISLEIAAEVKKISEIKNKRKRTSFVREKWSKYLLTCLLLLAVSGFMGRFRIIYIAFAGMCMSFCVISLLVSKSQ